MKSLTQDVDFIAAILKNSESVTVDATGKLIKRTAEIPSEDTTIRRTIYAVCLPNLFHSHFNCANTERIPTRNDD